MLIWLPIVALSAAVAAGMVYVRRSRCPAVSFGTRCDLPAGHGPPHQHRDDGNGHYSVWQDVA